MRLRNGTRFECKNCANVTIGKSTVQPRGGHCAANGSWPIWMHPCTLNDKLKNNHFLCLFTSYKSKSACDSLIQIQLVCIGLSIVFKIHVTFKITGIFAPKQWTNHQRILNREVHTFASDKVNVRYGKKKFQCWNRKRMNQSNVNAFAQSIFFSLIESLKCRNNFFFSFCDSLILKTLHFIFVSTIKLSRMFFIFAPFSVI